MTEHHPVYQLTELELIILNAYFLALPMPPLRSRDLEIADHEAEQALKQAAQSLKEKGYFNQGDAEDQGHFVLPGLAENLRAMAYGNQMVHFYLHENHQKPRQVAVYHDQGKYVGQELLEGGVHLIQKRDDFGESLVKEILQASVDGERGVNAEIPLEAWHLVLSSREAGNQDEVYKEILVESNPTGKDGVERRKALIKDVLKAEVILELTSVYDRLNHKQEKAAFILGKDANWLAMVTPNQDHGKLYALQVPQQNLLWAAGSIFAALKSSIRDTGRSA